MFQRLLRKVGAILMFVLLSGTTLRGQNSIATRHAVSGELMIVDVGPTRFYFPLHVTVGRNIQWSCENLRPLSSSPRIIIDGSQVACDPVYSNGIRSPIVHHHLHETRLRYDMSLTIEVPDATILGDDAVRRDDISPRSRSLKEWSMHREAIEVNFESGKRDIPPIPSQMLSLLPTTPVFPMKPLVEPTEMRDICDCEVLAASMSVTLVQASHFGKLSVRTETGSYDTAIIGLENTIASDSAGSYMRIVLHGNGDLSQDLFLNVTNLSPAAAIVEGGTTQLIPISSLDLDPLTISRRLYPPSGLQKIDEQQVQIAFALTDAVTGRREKIAAQALNIDAYLKRWQLHNQMEIRPEASSLITRHFVASAEKISSISAGREAQEPVDEALLNEYCFLLRDAKIHDRAANRSGGGLRLVQFSTGPPGRVITSEDVNRHSVVDFLKQFFKGTDTPSVGFLHVTSSVSNSPIFVDENSPKGYTDNAFVLTIGPHYIKIRPDGQASCEGPLDVEVGRRYERHCPQ